MATVSEALRAAIEAYPESRYRLAKNSRVAWAIIVRFTDGSRPNIKADTIDRLCASLGLELRLVKKSPKKAATCRVKP